MTHMRSFSTFDLLRFNNVNLVRAAIVVFPSPPTRVSSERSVQAAQDPLTETYNQQFYLQYLAKWPDFCFTAEGPGGRPMGYVLGKAESFREPNSWHGHVTAVTVPPEYRRLGMATQLMGMLEQASERARGWFVDLFVRQSNALAIDMYTKMGYSVYRQVIGYYSGTEDAYDMRKPLSRDVDKKSAIPLTRPVHPDEVD